ncbi:branched-chain amino acid aminotransferase [Neobacillus sp. Marseille-QA0830]
MLKNRVQHYIAQQENGQNGLVSLFHEEKAYAEKHGLVTIPIAETDAEERFFDAYIERCDKETENMIRNEAGAFLAQPLVYFYKHKNEFLYLESKWFDIVLVDAVSLELDDVFGTYDVMLGLKLQKKFKPQIQQYLTSHLHGEEASFDLLFNSEDGLWNVNFALNYIEGFDENMSIGEAYQLIYQFLFKLVESIESES